MRIVVLDLKEKPEPGAVRVSDREMQTLINRFQKWGVDVKDLHLNITDGEKLQQRLAELVCSECDSRIMDNGYCMMGHWCGKPLR